MSQSNYQMNYGKLDQSNSLNMFIESDDVSLVNVGKLRLWRWTNEEPDLSFGFSFNLFNNLYDT